VYRYRSDESWQSSGARAGLRAGIFSGSSKCWVFTVLCEDVG